MPDLLRVIDRVMRQLLFFILLLILSPEVYPQLLINEFSSSNNSMLADEDGDYSDWIELYNASGTDYQPEWISSFRRC